MFISEASTSKQHPIDNVQLSYLNNKKVQNFIQDPTNTFSFLTTESFIETTRPETSKRKPIDTLIKFLRSITPANDISANKKNQCWSSPCLNGAQCFGSSNSYLCVCLRGYTGLNCAEVMTDYRECSTEFCSDNGFCQIKSLSIPKANLKFCTCKRGYTGQHCEIEIRPSIYNRVTGTTMMSILNPTRTILLNITNATTTKKPLTTEPEKLYKKLSNINKTNKPIAG